jgi:hypothetical protein
MTVGWTVRAIDQILLVGCPRAHKGTRRLLKKELLGPIYYLGEEFCTQITKTIKSNKKFPKT